MLGPNTRLGSRPVLLSWVFQARQTKVINNIETAKAERSINEPWNSMCSKKGSKATAEKGSKGINVPSLGPATVSTSLSSNS